MTPILSHMNPIGPSHPVMLRYILILFSLLFLCFPSDLLSSGFLIRILYAFHLSLMGSIYPAHLILLEMIVLNLSESILDAWFFDLY